MTKGEKMADNKKQRKSDKPTYTYIFVNTNFKRKREPIFALAFSEHLRTLQIHEHELKGKSDEEVFEMVRKMIRQHYQDSDGKLMMWGNIVNYAYHHTDNEVYVFDRTGRLLKGEKVIENRATMSFGGN